MIKIIKEENSERTRTQIQHTLYMLNRKGVTLKFKHKMNYGYKTCGLIGILAPAYEKIKKLRNLTKLYRIKYIQKKYQR